MSNFERIQVLLDFLEEEPNNPFNLYALALEFQNIEREKAEIYFDKLLNEHKGYLPTYYHAAAFFEQKGDITQAKDIYKAGIALATQKGEQKTLKELKNAYMNFQFENE